jgi:hypothetical protein
MRAEALQLCTLKSKFTHRTPSDNVVNVRGLHNAPFQFATLAKGLH